MLTAILRQVALSGNSDGSGCRQSEKNERIQIKKARSQKSAGFFY